MISLSSGGGENEQVQSEDDGASQKLGVLVSVACAMFYSMANISSRQLKNRHYTLVGFYHSLFGLCTFGVFLLGMKLVTGQGF